MLYETAFYLYDRGRYAEAKPFYQQALHIRERQLGPEHLLVADTLNELAGLYHEQSNYAEAEPIFLRVLRIREQQLGPENLLVANPLNGLAILYCDQDRYAEAEPVRSVHVKPWQHGGRMAG